MIRKLRNLIDRATQRLADFGTALIKPIERLVSGTTDKVLTATEKVDHVESLLLRALYTLTWPVRFLWKILSALLPASVVRFAASSVHGLQSLLGRCGAALLNLAGTLNLDRAVLTIVWLLQPIWRPLAAFGVFIFSWAATRSYRRGLYALPAIGLVTLVLGIGTWHSLRGEGRTIAKYRVAQQQELELRNYDRAALYEKKLAQLGEDTQLSAYRTALALADEGKLEVAYERMQALAPSEAPGYPAAHFWIAQRLFGNDLVDDRDTALELAKTHLDHLETLDIEGPYLQLLRAILLTQTGELSDAAAMLEPLVRDLPMAAYERMRINLALKRDEQAKQDARSLINHMKTLKRRSTEFTSSEYQSWLAAEQVLGNLREIHAILEEWHAVEPDNEAVKQNLAAAYRQLARQELRAPLPNEQEIVNLWLKAAETSNSADSLLLLARALYRDREQTPLYQRLLTSLRESERTPHDLLLSVGTEAAVRQQYDDARLFLKAVVERDQSNAVAWNNYGLVLAEGEDPQLEEALAAVNRALELKPKEHRFRETRGQILVKFERWTEAIEDLEFALNGLPSLKAIHQSLALAYQAIGEEELSRLHQTQAEGLDSF